MNILYFRGTGQYDTPEMYTDDIRAVLEDRGHESMVVDLTREHVPGELLEQIRSFQPDCSLAINAIYPHWYDDGDLYDIIETPHVAILIDHPVYHMHRFQNPYSDRLIVTGVDRSHVDYLDFTGKERAAFLPHAVAERHIDSRDEVGDESEPEITFFGTVKDPSDVLSSLREEHPEEIMILAEDVANLWLDDEERSLFEAYRRVLDRRGMEDLLDDQELTRPILTLADKIYRPMVRDRIVRSMPRGKVEFYGNVAERYETLFSDAIHSKVDQSTMFEIMDQTGVVLNVSPFFSAGSHKRIVDGLARGTPVLTTYSSWVEEEFEPFGVVQQFEATDPQVHRDSAREALSSVNSMEEGMGDCQDYLREHHTWQVRADQILELLP